ncbi:hypothetical protein Ocin01_05517 [Orchesella cincta]|uniref:Uncharacterized protein n=1 Tax=Orchesella cincta TaxID=48709 RepID=A0A1D2N7C5_ORCCI|nr:hypothetical protein Ocin01_05517 [Orchesella cincta]
MNDGGGDLRCSMNPSSHPPPPDRRRRGKNTTGSYYNGQRDTRMPPSGYRSENRMSHRGGSGDGPPNYREYEGQQSQACGNQCPPSEPHSRGSHHQQPQQISQHRYSQPPPHHHQGKGSGSSRSDNAGMEYDSMPSTTSSNRRGMDQPRSGGGHPSTMPPPPPQQIGQPHMDHRNVHQQENCGPPQAPPPGFSGPVSVPPTEVMIIPQEQAHFANPNVHVGHFHAVPPFPPGPPPPTINFFGCHPNCQPMYGTLALCHIPFGVNPSAVISPCCYTQIIGSGMLAPGLPYNIPCGIPAPSMVQSSHSHPIFIQNHPQQHSHHHHHQPHGAPSPMPQVSDDCISYVDSSSILNPDADVFFPPQFPPADDEDDAVDSPAVDETEDKEEIKPEEDSTKKDVVEDEEEEENETDSKDQDEDDED